MELLVTGFTGIINVTLGLIAFLKNPQSATHRLFAILTIIISAWTITNYFSLHSGTESETLFWIRAVMMATAYLGPIILLLVATFPKPKVELPKKYIFIILLTGFLSLVLAPTPLMFTAVTLKEGVVSPTPGPAIAVFAISFIGSLVLSFFVLYRQYKKAQKLEKVQFKYLFLGIGLTFGLIAITNFVLVLFNISSLVFLGPSLSLILVGFITYAIVKHRFMDIRFVVVRSVVYLLLVATLALGYSGVLFLIGIFITGQAVSSINLVTSTILTLVFSITFQPLLRFFERITNNWLFKDRYDSNKLLHTISGILSSTLLVRDISEAIFRQLFLSMKVTSGHLIVYNSQQKIQTYSFHQDECIIETSQLKHLILKASASRKSDHLLIFEELEEGQTKQLMRKYGINVVLPLVVKKQLIGAFLLGEKGSGDIYSTQDIDVFKILALETSVAIQNALSYEEIKQFNVTLEDEVERATEKLRHANSKLKELDKLKDEFVSIASHELRTPMTAIKSYLWLAMNKSSRPVDAQTQKYLDISYKSTERLIGLVNDMLTVSRIERNKIELHKEVINLFEVARQVHDELQIKAVEREISFRLIPARGNFWVNGDKEKLREVIQNVVGNALKFTPEKGKISIQFEQDAEMVIIKVADTGPGIPASEMSKLFQKFQKLEYSYHSAQVTQPGSGLGLYISKQIVAMHHGTIAVDSVVGKGTTFILSIPWVDKSTGE